jgi:hypothetical protein
MAVTLGGCAGTAGSSAPTAAPRPPSAAAAIGATCHPAEILPFECGTYRSVWGAKSITGDAGGPAKDPLTLSVSHGGSGLVLHAVSAHCLTATVPFRHETTRLVPTGPATYGQGGCFGSGPNTRDWAYAFLRGPLVLDAGAGGLAFNERHAMVTFEYEGVTAPGSRPIVRTDRGCVPAHVVPFSCGTYRSVRGTGELAFLAAHPYRLSFEHINGELTAELMGQCNALSAPVEPDGGELVVVSVGSTLEACMGPPGARDTAFVNVLTGTVRFHVDGSEVTFTKGASSAVFRLG